MTATRTPMSVRKHADRSVGVRVSKFHPDTGERTLFNPANGEFEPWPLAGISFTEPTTGQPADPPELTRVPTSWVKMGIDEGWIELVNGRIVHRPGGPAGDLTQWSTTHTFLQADEMVFKTVDGEVRYKVIHNPDKYVVVGVQTINEEKGLIHEHVDDEAPVTPEIYESGETAVHWFYDLELVP